MHADKDIDVEPSEEEDLDPEPLPEGIGQKGGADPWFPESEPFEDFLEIEERKREIEGVNLAVLPSQFTEFAFRMPRDDGRGYAAFSFNGRRHMLRPYDTPAKHILLFAARQVEKSCRVHSYISTENGSQKRAGDVVLGDRLATLNCSTQEMTSGRVTWVSRIYQKPCLKITTRQGHVMELAGTHPVRQWQRWTEASELMVGDRVAAVRRCGDFGAHCEDPRHIELTAFMIGDGGLTQPTWRFTGHCGLVTDRFEALLDSLGATYRVHWSGNDNMDIALRHHSTLRAWMEGDGLVGKYSYEKTAPPWVFDLSREDTALFLNRLWSTDGHIKRLNQGKYDMVYATTSRELSRQVQSLLWKFGIPSGIRENRPSYVCKNGEPARIAYLLRVETQEGIRRFLLEIGALGKSEGVPVPDVASNNNRDTLPIEVNDLIRAIVRSNPRPRSGRNAKVGSLLSAGLRAVLEYPLTYDKLERYVHFFRADPAYDQEQVEVLAQHVRSDVYWDEIKSIEDIGEQDCVDFEVEEHHNFVVDGVVTHNSTLVGNFLLGRSCLIAAHKSLYVSPSATQTKTFSADRVKEPIETSPILKSFTTRGLSQNILEKQFVNRSKITLRYAFLNADRCRGIAAWLLALDELQDILSDNIPVIEQCTSHAPEQFKTFIYAGTPKGSDNPLEYYRSGVAKDGRSMSTQGEWVVPCDAHGGETGRHWNILGERNIGKKGLICDRCGKRIDVQHPDAQWANMVDNGVFQSFRIPQLMVPWRSWSEIMLDYTRYTRDRFYNEVLGLSFDSGSRPLTAAQLQTHCNPKVVITRDSIRELKEMSRHVDVFAGVDHGIGENAYTVLSLGMYPIDAPTKFRIFYLHRFTGEEVEHEVQVAKLIKILRGFNVRVIGSDWGMGFATNQRLVRAFGPERLAKFKYEAKIKRKVQLNPKLQNLYQVHRTEVMTDVFDAIKRGHFEFPCWEQFREPFAQDFLNIFSEYNRTLRMIQYDHRPDRPDDSFHSVLYCFLAACIVRPRPDILVPKKEFPNVGPLFGSGWSPVDQG